MRMRACPYCATRLVLDRPGLVDCRGCGNPVSLEAETIEIAEAVSEPIWKQAEFAQLRRPMQEGAVFPGG